MLSRQNVLDAASAAIGRDGAILFWALYDAPSDARLAAVAADRSVAALARACAVWDFTEPLVPDIEGVDTARFAATFDGVVTWLRRRWIVAANIISDDVAAIVPPRVIARALGVQTDGTLTVGAATPSSPWGTATRSVTAARIGAAAARCFETHISNLRLAGRSGAAVLAGVPMRTAANGPTRLTLSADAVAFAPAVSRVRTLSHVRVDDLALDHETAAACIPTLLRELASLPALRTLALHGVAIGREARCTETAPVSTARSARARARAASREHRLDVWSGLADLRTVETLTVEFCGSSKSTDDLREALYAMPRLLELHMLDGTGRGDLCIDLGRLPLLRTLEIESDTIPSLENRFSLADLSIKSPSAPNGFPDALVAELERARAFQRLHVCVPPHAWKYMNGLLGRVRVFESLVLATADGGKATSGPPRDRLADVLGTPRGGIGPREITISARCFPHGATPRGDANQAARAARAGAIDTIVRAMARAGVSETVRIAGRNAGDVSRAVPVVDLGAFARGTGGFNGTV